MIASKTIIQTSRGEFIVETNFDGERESISVVNGYDNVVKIEILADKHTPAQVYAWNGIDEDYVSKTPFTISLLSGEVDSLRSIYEDVQINAESQGLHLTGSTVLNIAKKVQSNFSYEEYNDYISELIEESWA